MHTKVLKFDSKFQSRSPSLDVSGHVSNARCQGASSFEPNGQFDIDACAL